MTTEPLRPQVISVRLHAKGRLPVVNTMAKQPSRKMPRSAVQLSATVWYMPKTKGLDHGNNAQVFITHLDWTYCLRAREWDAVGMIEPRIEVLS